VGIRDEGSGPVAYYGIGRCDDADCNDFTGFLGGDFGPVTDGPHTLSVSWNETANEFTFGLDTAFDTVPGIGDPPLPAVLSTPKYPFKAIGARVDPFGGPDSGGHIVAKYDNVYRNGSFHDDFNAPTINYANWDSWEVTRQVNNGVFECAIARYGSNGGTHLNFFDVNAITAFQADVTVKEVVNNGATPRARLASAFYNDGTPGEGHTGDIIAGIVILHNGIELVGGCYVTRCTQPDCNLPGEYENLWNDFEAFGLVSFDEMHRLSIAWDADNNTFTFKFDGASVTTDVALPAVATTPQGPPFNGIGTRVHGIGDVGVPPFEGEGAYIRAEFDNVFLLTDILSPFATLQTPSSGATNVSLSTNIVVHVQDVGTGVDPGTILMTVNGSLIYDGANPGDYPYTAASGSPAAYLLTYDPPDDFGNSQEINVTMSASDVAGNAMVPAVYSFITEPEIGNPWEPPPEDADNDGDGISNSVETGLLGTDPNSKTLFVRPKRRTGFLSYVYWDGFIALFPWAGRPGFANIPPFTNAGIEVSVIGDLDHPYAPMRAFDYDPETDANHPPCDILEVVYMRDNDDCDYSLADNEGHTFFTGLTWSWDTKGYTPHNSGTAHYLKYGYFTAQVYPYPLTNYFTEGAYNSIAVGQSPVLLSAGSCSYEQCWDYANTGHSPMNLNAGDPVDGLPDGTVEFNVITYLADGAIQSMGPLGLGYDSPTVLKRTIVHEMGHALLFALDDEDHCDDFECIMFHSTKDWELHNFGSPSGCIHSPGGTRDIRANGVVHNRVH
jgi:hypothetical protein